jgi:hypothetical protein
MGIGDLYLKKGEKVKKIGFHNMGFLLRDSYQSLGTYVIFYLNKFGSFS